jgi:hypothetical protein
MSFPGRSLQPGDEALTDYSGRGSADRVRIIEREDRGRRGPSQSGILFRVEPLLKNGISYGWYDADWFEPLNSQGRKEPK